MIRGKRLYDDDVSNALKSGKCGATQQLQPKSKISAQLDWPSRNRIGANIRARSPERSSQKKAASSLNEDETRRGLRLARRRDTARANRQIHFVSLTHTSSSSQVADSSSNVIRAADEEERVPPSTRYRQSTSVSSNDLWGAKGASQIRRILREMKIWKLPESESSICVGH